MKICVTGANGFIGSKVIEQLKEKYDIVALNRKHSETMGNVMYIKTDYSYEELIHTLKGCNAILHLAAQKVVPYEPEGLNHYLRNIEILQNVIHAAKHLNIKNITTISSRCVYGYYTDTMFSEQDNLNPINFYGVEKIMEEQLCLYCNSKYNLNIKVIRLSQVISDDISDTNLFTAFIKKALSGSDIGLVGDGSLVRDYIYIKDVVRILERVVLSNHIGIFNLGSSNTMSVFDIATKVINYTKSNSKISFIESSTNVSDRIVLDIDKLKKDFDIEPNYNVDLIIKDLCDQNIDWFD